MTAKKRKIKIPFNIPLITGKEAAYLAKVIEHGKFSGDGIFTKKCNAWLERRTKTKKALLTTSCTHALEMSALLANIKEGDEVIMSSYTFVSTANAFVLRGAKIIFVDIRPDTMNINEAEISHAITKKTKAIIPVHYAGIACEMDVIMDIAHKHKLLVIEDAAQAVMASYKGKPLGGIGHIGCYSFHETKNYHCGEGGAILINDDRFLQRCEVIREKGTNRSQFLKGEISKYTWIDLGSSYLPSELNAVFLYSHLKIAEDINTKRLALWQRYYENLKDLEEIGLLDLPKIPSYCRHNAHSFFIKLRDSEERQKMIIFLNNYGIEGATQYIPLHITLAGKKYGKFLGKDKFTQRESERLLRLPLYYQLDFDSVDYISEQLHKFYYD